MIEYVPNNPRWWSLATDDMSERPEGYYFWDESGNACCGPYASTAQARMHLEMYEDSLESSND